MSFGDYYHQQLLGSGKLDWLIKERGIGLKAIRAFKLGFVREPAVLEHETYKGCLVIPYYDGRGRERTIRFRSFRGKPKYLSLPKSEPHLFAIKYADEPRVFVVEGELDAITIWQSKRRAVGVPGANLWKDEWKWCFRNCEEVIVLFDQDQAGREGAARIVRSLRQVVAVRGIELPDEMDVNELYCKDRRLLEGLLQ